MNNGSVLVLDPGTSTGGNIQNSEIRMGGFGNYNGNAVSLQVSGRLSDNSLLDPSVQFRADDHLVDGTAILGLAPNGFLSYGVWGMSTDGVGVTGSGTGEEGWGIYGEALGALGIGVFGATSDLEEGWGVFSSGDLGSDGIKYFHIDHPLDPANKVLNHACAEGPEPLNIYSGNVTLDGTGKAIVNLPPYFEALNKDFRYSLTPIGQSAPDLYISQEVKGNHFAISGGNPNLKVTWRVEGVRNDLYAQRYGKPVEALKVASDRGKFYHPEVYGKSEMWAINNRKAKVSQRLATREARRLRSGP